MLLDESTIDEIESLSIDGPDDRLLLAEAMLGEDALQFVSSDLGRYIMGRINQDRAEAYLALGKTAWWRKRRIIALQQKIDMTESLMTYLREAIVSGKSAIAELDKRQSTGEI